MRTIRYYINSSFIKKFHLSIYLLILMSTNDSAFAQVDNERRIQDSVVGWWTTQRFDNLLKPSTDPVYKKRVAIDDQIVSWMKKSYQPVGGLGTYRRQNFKNVFGVYFMVWNVSFDPMWLDEKKQFKPISEENTPFGIQANAIPGSYPIEYFNEVSKSYYFTWPADGYTSEPTKRKDLALKQAPASKTFFTRSNELQAVFIGPENRLPFLPVTIGEYLDMASASYEKQLKNRKDRIDSQWPGSSAADQKSRESAYEYVVKEYEGYKQNIFKYKEKYQSRLTEPAVLRNMQPSFIGDFSNGTNPFEISSSQKERNAIFPVYKLLEETMIKCQSPIPQWIAAWYPYERKEDGNQLYEMYRSMTEHINYDYIYNYFYDTIKVKGKEYRPLNEEDLTQRLNAYRNKKGVVSSLPSATTKNGAWFSDDLSDAMVGNKPRNWYFRTYGEHHSVAQINGLAGNWIKLGYNNPITPTGVKKPLPKNFSFEFDLATDAFSERTGAKVNLLLSSWELNEDGTARKNGNGFTYSLSFTAGDESDYNNNNYSGELLVALSTSPAVNSENGLEGAFIKKPLLNFTNRKRKIHVELKIINGGLELFVNGNKLATTGDFKLGYGGGCNNCQLRSDQVFNYFQFKNQTNNATAIGAYIGNITIKAL
ncbi:MULTISPECIES: hypothetical protein [unclassified Paraflavitalea]|uniref:hypothetical protein n=1 Tax=unclassified Paraflavitalea TaxID=2798305 RepID=UPI003D35773F